MDGTTVLFVSLSLPQIWKMCNRAVWLNHGEMKRFGENKEVCNAYEQH